jgi:DNA-binding GntR family transcriptional regulator
VQSQEGSVTHSVPDEVAARVRRLPAAEQRQALAYLEMLERAADGEGLAAFAGTIPPADLAVMAAAIEADCERVDAGDW